MHELIKDVALMADTLVTAVLVLMHLLILRGFLPLFLRPDGTAVWHLAASYVWLSSAIGARAIYWAYAPDVVRTFLGKGIVNVLFGAALIYGAYLVLKLLWLIIPDIDRGKYSILTAPWYPASSEWRISVLLNLLRRTRGG